MSVSGVFVRGIVTFSILLISTLSVSSAELGKIDTFAPEEIKDFSLSPQQHLWFLSENRFMETEFVDGQWTAQRLIVPASSHSESQYIYDFAVTENHLWTIESDRVSVSELSDTQPYLKNTQELMLPNPTSENVDMVVALDGSGVVTNVDSGIYVMRLTNQQLNIEELTPASCSNPKNIQMTNQWLVVECNNSNIVVYKNTGQGFELLHYLSGRFIFLNTDTASVTIYNSEQYKISTISLVTLAEINSISAVYDVHQHSNNSLVLVETNDQNAVGKVRLLLRLNSDGSLAEEIKFATQNFSVGLVDYASFSSFLFETSDKIFRGFDYWLKNAETGIYEFRGNDWQHKIGLSIDALISFPASNTFLSGRSGKQIWSGKQGEIPKLAGYAQLMTDDYQIVQIQRAVMHQQKLWVVGADFSDTYVGFWSGDQKFKQIRVPFERSLSSIDGVHYVESTDSIIISAQGNDFIECQNASLLNSAEQCRILSSPENMNHVIITKNGALVFRNSSENTSKEAVMYDLTTSGLQERWRLGLTNDYAGSPYLLYAPEHDIVLGKNGYIVLTGASQGSFVGTSLTPLTTQGCQFVNSLDVLCGFGRFKLFRFNEGFNLHLEITPSLESSPFRQGNVQHSDQSGHVLMWQSRALTWHNLELPPVSFSNNEFVTEAIQDQNVQLDLSEHLSPLLGVTITHEEISIPDAGPKLLASTRLSETSWAFNTKNEMAFQNSVFYMSFRLLSDLWDMRFGYQFKLLNVNDAPIVQTGNLVNDLDIGDTYLLEFADVFEDIDGDILQYTTSALPAGFVNDGGGILATPVTAGRYQFTVTATDPSGMSVIASFSGSIIGQTSGGSGDSDDKSSGGSTGILSLMLLAALWLRYRSSYTK
ncbi:MAG: Ig domain-containing protein [Pararheinheimera sp.]|nr:Ig domain-containing protein [Rheinheimera sp.]